MFLPWINGVMLASYRGDIGYTLESTITGKWSAITITQHLKWGDQEIKLRMGWTVEKLIVYPNGNRSRYHGVTSQLRPQQESSAECEKKLAAKLSLIQ